MRRVAKAAVAVILAVTLSQAAAQSPKQLKTRSGVSVVVVTLLNVKPDCSAMPGPIALPTLREKPANGIVQMQVVAADIPASGNCPARKIPTIALIYTPRKDFVGTDSIQVEVEAGNRTTTLSYSVVVGPTAEPL